MLARRRPSLLAITSIALLGVACSTRPPSEEECTKIADNVASFATYPMNKRAMVDGCKNAEPEAWEALRCAGRAASAKELEHCGSGVAPKSTWGSPNPEGVVR